jgi:hypothetical protein
MDGWMPPMDGCEPTTHTHSTPPKIKFRSPLRNFLHARFLKADRKEPVWGERPKGGVGICKKLTLKKGMGFMGNPEMPAKDTCPPYTVL